MSTNKPNNVVFIGNIPFDQTEESLKEIFSQVGPTVSFRCNSLGTLRCSYLMAGPANITVLHRLIFDPDTNRPKGFAFCEYPDIATAATAVRNLNGYDIGSRQLRVDFSEKESYGAKGSSSASDSKTTNLLPPLPEGKIPPPGVSVPNAISQTLQAYPPQQLADILSKLKAVATNNPEQARQLLGKQPQLAYATFQAMLMMNLVDPAVLQHVVLSTGQASQQPAPPPPQTYTPPQTAYAPPPPASNVDPQRLALIQRVMSLTEEQLSILPPDQRAQLVMLRQQFASGQFE